jgi:hypothetical protein
MSQTINNVLMIFVLPLVTVVPPTKEEDAAPALTEAAAPEVITEKKPAEGEAAPAADAAKGDKKK